MFSSFPATRFPALPLRQEKEAAPPIYKDTGTARTAEEPSDESLLSQISTGDQDALAVLFRRYARLVRSVSVRILRDEGESEDLVQELFLFIYRGAAPYDSAKSSARSWIVQMTYRRAISRWRHLNARGHYKNSELNGCVQALQHRGLLPTTLPLKRCWKRRAEKKVMADLTAEQLQTLRLHFCRRLHSRNWQKARAVREMFGITITGASKNCVSRCAKVSAELLTGMVNSRRSPDDELWSAMGTA
jgi:DNA-directed RNA polymerase specialized sigma24 family protein